ncbi:hypothetical protein F5146DRAFT_1002102 [Armillaria mellea]|nr:hypothetical protein F5146DRAFT_1002102 [Armillaria mellea]
MALPWHWWLGPLKEYLQRYSKFCNDWYDPKQEPFSSFADLHLCVVTKPCIPSMSLTFGQCYEKEFQEFSRYIDMIPGDQKPPAFHIKLKIHEMPHGYPPKVTAFNTFCTNLAGYNSVVSFTVTANSDKLKALKFKALDVKVPNSCQPVFHPPPFAALTTLHLVCVSDHFFDWMLRSAAASPICELTLLHGFQNQHPIHIPTLRKLTLGGMALTTSQVVRLLLDKVHLSIGELTFLGEPFWEMPVKGRLIPLGENAMPSLTRLIADYNILTNLLVTPKAFPKLEHVEVYSIDSSIQDPSIAKVIAELLSRISFLPSVHCVVFPVSVLEPMHWDILSDRGIILLNVTKFIEKHGSV